MPEFRATVQLKHITTWGELKKILEDSLIPDDARIRVDDYKGDAREPGYTNIIATWGNALISDTTRIRSRTQTTM